MELQWKNMGMLLTRTHAGSPHVAGPLGRRYAGHDCIMIRGGEYLQVVGRCVHGWVGINLPAGRVVTPNNFPTADSYF
jgi:hypothetical protein